MSSQKLSQKYAPQNVGDLIGGTQKRACSYLLENKPQISLLTGPSGNGKTSIARIYAAELLNCTLAVLGTNEEPFEYRYVNARDKSAGVDFWRDITRSFDHYILEPIVYVIDECDQMHIASQKHLNTPLENGGLPENVYMVFCTLNPEGLQADFLSRLNPKFHLDSPTAPEQKRHMMDIFEKESIGIEGHSSGDVIISPNDADNVFQSAGGNLRQLMDNIQAIKAGIFQLTDDIDTELVFDLLSGGCKDIGRVFKSLHGVGNYTTLSDKMCKDAIYKLSYGGADKNLKRIINVFGNGIHGTNPRNAFHKLVVDFLDSVEDVM